MSRPDRHRPDWNTRKLKFLADVSFSSVDRKDPSGKKKVEVDICHYPDAYANEFITRTTAISKGHCTPDELERFGLRVGQTIITKDSESPDDIGIPVFVAEDREGAVCGYHLAIIEPRSEDVDARFLFRFLQSKEVMAYYEMNCNGVTRFGLGKPTIQSLPIPLPARSEQQKIASFLDHQTGLIDELIEKNTKLLELLDDQRKAIINEAVTKGLDPKALMKDSGVEWLGEVPKHWELARLKRHFTIQKRIAGELGYDVLSVTQRGLRVKDLDNLQGQHSMDYTKYQLVYPGDFVMNHMDLLTGYVDLSNQTGVTSPDYRVFTATSEGVDNMFYLFLFQLGYFRRIFYGMGRGVSDIGRWRLPATEFNDFMIPVPPLEEQHRIATHLSEQRATLDILGTQTTDLIDRLKEYRQSIISEAVTGKIDLRAWVPAPQQTVEP